MVILGLLLVLVSVAAAVALLAYNSGGATQPVELFGWDLGNLTMMAVFVAGLVVAVVFMIGLNLVLFAGRRARADRARYRATRKETKAVAAERDDLAKQLHDDNTGTPASGPREPAFPQAPPPPDAPPPTADSPRHAAPGGQ